MIIDSFVSYSPHGFHRVSYTDWGDRQNSRIAICVHGLTRNARDFDFLAQVLAHSHRVVCPDIVGRGLSDWLANASDYGYAQYITDLNALMARVTGASSTRQPFAQLTNWLRRHRHGCSIDWIGTSMGGILGMLVAAVPGSPIR